MAISKYFYIPGNPEFIQYQGKCFRRMTQQSLAGETLIPGTDVEVFGRVDPDNDSDYDAAVGNHVELAGNVQEWITNTLDTSTLEESVTGYTNALKAYNVRLEGFERDIDSAEAMFQDTFSLEVYLKEA